MTYKLITAALIGAVAISPAFAGSDVDTFELTLEIDRAQMQTADGATVAYEQIREHVADQCKKEAFPLRVIAATNKDECVSRTLDAAVESIDEPELTTVHTSASGENA